MRLDEDVDDPGPHRLWLLENLTRNNQCLKVYKQSKDVFPSTHIKGDVCGVSTEIDQVLLMQPKMLRRQHVFSG